MTKFSNEFKNPYFLLSFPHFLGNKIFFQKIWLHVQQRMDP